jgi:ribosomal protein S11
MAKQIRKTTKNEDSETTKRCSSFNQLFNNTIVTITNLKGEVIGHLGLFKGARNRRLLLRQQPKRQPPYGPRFKTGKS